MREKNLNKVHIEGYVYDVSKLELKVAGPTAKNPGSKFIKGNIRIAVDEKGENLARVDFVYVGEKAKTGQPSQTFNTLKQLIDEPQKSWSVGGKEAAIKVAITGSLARNEYINRDEQRVSIPIVTGSFVNIVNKLSDESERATYQADVYISNVTFVPADEETRVKEDYVRVDGIFFNFRNEILPGTFVVHNKNGMKYFEDLDVSEKHPIFTKIWGKIDNTAISKVETEESAFGESVVHEVKEFIHEWTITGTSKVPYDFGDDAVLTKEDIKEARQTREVLWATRKKERDEYIASQGTPTNNISATKTMSTPVSGDFSF